MSRVRGGDTGPEMAVRRIVWGLGYRYRLHVKDLPGSPDLVLRRLGKVIFVHGCFWHRHPRCRKSTMPKTRVAFWKDKFAKNVARDKRVLRQLRKGGWSAMIVWQCQLKHSDAVRERLREFLEKQ
jgi:DNA mismatch endonuclease (patch repair protein)